MVIVRNAAAGTMESSDAMVTVSPGKEGIRIELGSTVYVQFGRQIENLVRQVQHSQLELVASFADIPLRLSQILKLQPGDVLPIEKPDRIIAHVDGVPVLTSQYGTINGQYALRVEHLINPILNSLNEEQPK